MVMVNQQHLRALVNFVLNSKLLLSTEGSSAGVAPPLLAPIPFLMATATQLKVS